MGIQYVKGCPQTSLKAYDRLKAKYNWEATWRNPSSKRKKLEPRSNYGLIG